MTFNACIYPFEYKPTQQDKIESFFTNAQNRLELLRAVRREIKWETGEEYLGEREGKCLARAQIARENFLADLQEHAASLENSNLEAVYTGTEQTTFNHLIEIRNNIGIYLPVYFFFPIRISLQNTVFPIFVGSLPKLQKELSQINTNLNAREKLKINEIPYFITVSEEDVEDYESSHEGVELFWVAYSYCLLEKLVNRALEAKFPVFIY